MQAKTLTASLIPARKSWINLICAKRDALGPMRSGSMWIFLLGWWTPSTEKRDGSV